MLFPTLRPPLSPFPGTCSRFTRVILSSASCIQKHAEQGTPLPPLGAGLSHADPRRKPTQVINDALAPRASFVRNYLDNPRDTYLDPVLRHHLGLTGLPAKKVKQP
jgi:hypothetical protein